MDVYDYGNCSDNDVFQTDTLRSTPAWNLHQHYRETWTTVPPPADFPPTPRYTPYSQTREAQIPGVARLRNTSEVLLSGDICHQVTFFDKALTGDFSEASTRVVNLPDDDLNVLERFLEFLYTGAYKHDSQAVDDDPFIVDEDKIIREALLKRMRELKESDEADRRELHTERDLYLHLRLYVMADKFNVPALKQLAQDRFYRVAKLSWETLECFPTIVGELYTWTLDTDFGLREIVCSLVASGMWSDEQKGRLEWVMRKHGDFAVEVLDHFDFAPTDEDTSSSGYMYN
ncbi:hypothetical protein N658DRAFT_527229 [Parathielavia hyrcaniae]|uniref:BTB domain-containing protein n=1 Tax=Parathielavia hyrcaniae TaxID=113614 RepID=A0AAN6SY77_9PEZI|nr:hypothetical protein N658DRAFT_527229 [Parathielavia hyrcaniae]